MGPLDELLITYGKMTLYMWMKGKGQTCGREFLSPHEEGTAHAQWSTHAHKRVVRR